MTTTLLITNDFPPRIGGIESFNRQLCDLLGDIVVLTRSHPAAVDTDRELPFPVYRQGQVLLPTAGTAAAAERLLRRHRISRVIFGAAAPLGLLAPRLSRAGADRQLAISHGHETWWARLPGSRLALRRIGDHVDAISYISGFTRAAIAPALSPAARSAMVRLAPPVDTDLFVPGPRSDRPTVVAAGRMVRQKGFDTLLAAWDQLLREWSGTVLPQLVLIGEGPQYRRLTVRARSLPAGSVHFTGAVAHHAVPEILAQSHVFALPVRTRLGGLNPEGLGLVFAEAAACGLAVLAGDSGGAADTMIPGESGFLLDPESPAVWAAKLATLLADPGSALRMGDRGRAHVIDRFAPAQTAAVLKRVLDLS